LPAFCQITFLIWPRTYRTCRVSRLCRTYCKDGCFVMVMFPIPEPLPVALVRV
jgi:hypothetical protein